MRWERDSSMHHDDDFAALMERVRQGCPEAIREMLHRYGGHIRAVVRRQLHQRLRPQFDSLDFQQDVWASFFSGDLDRYHFNRPEALVRYLSKIAYNKVVEVFRQKLQTDMHDVNRERSLDELHFDEVASQVTARHPSPSQVAMANEKWQRLLQRQPEHHRRMLELLRQGYTHVEIAHKLHVDPKMVQRFLHSLKERGEAQ
jgi:RNA polymerase sigma-70 factor (ECF subfamily)